MKAIARRFKKKAYASLIQITLLLFSGLSFAQSPPQSDPCGRNILSFDGTDDYLDVQGTTINGNSGTWEAWVRKDDWSIQNDGILFGNDIAFNATNTIYLSFHSGVGLHFRYGDVSSEPTTGGAIYGQFTNGFVANSWHHIAVTWEHVTGTTTLKMFIDGVEQTSFTAGSRTTHNALIDPGSSLNFGKSTGNGGTANQGYLEAGSLAEIRTWDVARTETEIANSMNTILSGSESGLTGYWTLDETLGATSATNLVSGAPTASLTNIDANSAWDELIESSLALDQEGLEVLQNGSFDFSLSESGNSFTKTFTITNQSGTTLSLTGSPIVTLAGVDNSEFVLDLSGTSSSLSPSATTTFDLTFTPGSVGMKSANLSIDTDDACLPTYTINISGESVITTKPDQIIISNSSPCLNEEITLSVDGGLIFGDTEWVWYEGDGTATSIGTGTSISITPENSSRYLVRAESMGNPLSDFTISPTVILSNAVPVVIETDTKDAVVPIGSSYTMSVRASGSNLTYQWQKDGVDISNGGNLSGTQSDNLVFSSVSASDDGVYTCVVSNDCSSLTSSDAELTATSTVSTSLPYSEDFESTDGGFISSNLKGPTTWEYGTPAGGSNSGTEAWETDLDGNIQNNEINVLTSPAFLLSPDLAGAELSFQLNYDLTLFQQSGTPVTDRWFQAAELNISNDNGATWTKISDFEEGGYNRSSGFIFNDANLDWPLWTDNSGGWVTVRVNVSDYVGQSVLFRMIVSTTSGFAGWYFGTGAKVDDWSLTELDNTSPSASLNITQASVNNTALEMQLSFSEEVAMTLTNLSATNGSLSNLQTADNKTFTFDATPSSGGYVTVGIDDMASPIQDLAGNDLSNSPSITFLNDNVDLEVVLYTSEDPVFDDFTADIVFSKAVSNFVIADISVGNANLSNLQTTDNINYTVDVAPSITSGTVTLLVAGMVAEDQFGNLNNASNSLLVEFNPAIAPVLEPIGDKTIDEEVELTFSVNATDSNQGDVIAYSLDATSVGKGMTIDGSTGTFNWTPSESQDGDHMVTIAATDDSAGTLSDSETITITVNEINQNPTVTVGPSVWDIPEDAYASRSYQISDPDGQDVMIALDANAHALGFGLLDVSNPVVNKLLFWTAPLEVDDITFDVTMTVTDGVGGSTDFEITINMQEVNQLPTLAAIGDQSVDELSELAFTIAGSDADVPTQSITYSISDGLLTGMSIDDQTGDFSWTPTEAQSGSHSVTFEIMDDFTPTAGTNSEAITITVNEVNVAPVMDAVGDQSIDERSELTFTVSATDEDDPSNELAYSLDATSLSKGMTIDVSTGGFSWTPTEEQDGDHTVTITVTDDGSSSLTDEETITITVIEISNIWNGNSWSDGFAPDEMGDAAINGDFDLSIDGVFAVRNLQVASDMTLVVDGENALMINGDLTNDGNIIIESGSSLITYSANTLSGNDITIKRNTRYADGKYSFVGTPVLQDAGILGSGLGSSVYKYNETIAFGADGINRWEDASSDQLTPGTGYTQAFQEEITFIGTPNDGSIIHSATYTEDTDDANEGWNLVSNPYPAAISVSDFLTANTNIAGAVYIWDDNGSDTQRGSNSDYIIANGTMATNSTPAGGETRYNQHLGSAEGFFVKLNDNTDLNIDFTESMRVGDSNGDDNFFRTAPLPLIRVNLTNEEGLFKQAVIGIAEDANSAELNRAYDAPSFNSRAANGIFTQKALQTLALNGQPANWQEVALQVNAAEVGSYQISVETENYNHAVFLRDTETGEVVDLTKTAYTFNTKGGITTDRFQLLSHPSGILGNGEINTSLIYAYQSKLYIIPSNNEERSYKLYTISGRDLLSHTPKGRSVLDLSHLDKGVYLVFDGEQSHKIILK